MFIEFYKDDTLLKLCLLGLNTLNLFYCIETTYCLPITIILVLIYLNISNESVKEKKKIIGVWLVFSLLTLIGESIVISLNSKSPVLNYKNPDIINVPSWLISAYLNMVILVLVLYKNI
jgi:hypothetical protein